MSCCASVTNEQMSIHRGKGRYPPQPSAAIQSTYMSSGKHIICMIIHMHVLSESNARKSCVAHNYTYYVHMYTIHRIYFDLSHPSSFLIKISIRLIKIWCMCLIRHKFSHGWIWLNETGFFVTCSYRIIHVHIMYSYLESEIGYSQPIFLS